MEKAKKSKFMRASILVSVFLIVYGILMITSAPKKYSLNIGDIADVDIDAPANMVDKVATEMMRREAANNVQPIYKVDLTVQIELEKTIEQFFDQLEEQRNNEELSLEEKLRNIENNHAIELDKASYELLLTSSPQELIQTKENIKYLINQILNERLSLEQMESKKEEIVEFFTKLPKQNKLNDIGAQIAVTIIKPNLLYDEEETELRREEARADIEEILIKKGTRIVSKGQEVNEQQIQLLKAYGLLKDENGKDMRISFSYGALLMATMIVFCLYIWRLCPNVWTSNSVLLMVCINIIITLMIAVGTRPISHYMMPIPACAFIVTILVNTRIAIVTNIVLVIAIGFLTEFNTTLMVAFLLSGVLGSIIVAKTHHRSMVIYAGLASALINTISIVSFGLINNIEIKYYIYDVTYGIVGGIFTSVLTIGLLPFFESAFDIITPTKLLELTNPNQPLLRRLMIEAPGTYYHSILVGNLSEAAAEEVGANALLCRAGSYYHDIGKLKRPYFFKENQMTQDNPHDKISPNLSASIIISHVKDGVETAKKNKLPSRVIDIISQHHGDTLVAYFYHKALKAQGEETVEEDKFRYPWQKPQSKEAAIVMLADSVEAFVRSLSEPSKEEVEKGVRKIVFDKINDNQLSECSLTLKDMESIIQAFVKVLEGIFHERIEYPENLKEI
ncbi:MAG: HD family phosphohydrolase [Lutispora sp.]|jgi:putative nucleotidyltransferase with HDIG domain|uniref:HD family phosphohydrolase n=1 Tax=Lutispora sp. TaxID=2828727 RepID=UPI0035684F5B